MSHQDLSNNEIIQCIVCLGSGLVKMTPIKCGCPTTFCMKCENNSGFIVKPYETCETCYGSGAIIKKKHKEDKK